MLHVLTTLLATALLASSTGANPVKNYETHEEQNKTALRAGPKRAYYDPTETYGDTPNTAYLYADLNYFNDVTTKGLGWSSIPEANNNITVLVSVETFELSQLTIYKNGVLDTSTNFRISQGNQGVTVYNLVWEVPQEEKAGTAPYFWVFDHQEIDPIEEMNENIFEAVGDTITGLSDALASPWEGILNIFYDTTENEVTQIGYLVLIGLGVSITLLVFWTILRLFKQRN